MKSRNPWWWVPSLSHSDFSAGNTWYVPGYGKYGDTRIGANFNVIIDI